MESTTTISFTVNNQDLPTLISLLGYTISASKSPELNSEMNKSLQTQIESILKHAFSENEFKELISAMNRNFEQMKTTGLFDKAEEIAKNSAEEFKLNLS